MSMGFFITKRGPRSLQTIAFRSSNSDVSQNPKSEDRPIKDFRGVLRGISLVISLSEIIDIDTGEQPGWRQLAEDGLPLGRSQVTV